MMQDFPAISNKRTRIKFCGMTQLADALYAESLGVDALGFVFYEKSPRLISIAAAEQICDQLLPFTTRVGLFVNPTIQDVKTVLQKVKLDLLQFHGDETEDFCQQFKIPYIKAISVRHEYSVATALQQYASASGILLDSFDKDKKGGTGTCFDWSLIPSNCSKALILAGGLTPENVYSAITQIKPYAVDVSSGIELNKTKKDWDKMRRFVAEVNR